MKRLLAPIIALPEPIKASILAVILYLVGFGVAHLIALVPFLSFLTQFVMPLAAAIGMALIAWIEKTVPDAYDKVAISAIQLVLAILAVFGVGTTLAAMNVLPSLLAPK